MASRDQQVEDLQRELALVQMDFSTRIKKLEQKITDLSSDSSSLPIPTPTQHFQEPELESQSLPPAEHHDVQLASMQPSSEQPQSAPIPRSTYINTLMKEAGALVTEFLSPVTKFVSPVLRLYQHYSAKGQGPIFVFTLIGIALLVAGFAYLAQLLIGELGAGSRSLLLFVIAIGVTCAGLVTSRKSRYSELGSAIVGLGLLLNFVTVYVAGSFYHLLPTWMVLLSYFAIACTGFIIAKLLDSKIVSVLSVIGGSAIPLISQLDQTGITYYLLGLSFLILASLYLSLIKQWRWMAWVSISLAYVCIEFLLLTTPPNPFLGYFSQAFYCLFVLYIANLLSKREAYEKDLIMLMAVTVFANIGILYQSDFAQPWLMPTFAIFNLVVSLFLLVKAKTRDSYAVSLYTILASTWGLVAIISSLAPDYWGFAIGLEGLFLLYFALRENYASVRFEAYSLIVFAVLHALVAVLPYFPSPALLSLKGNLVIASIGALIFASRKLLSHFPNDLNWDKQLAHRLRQAESVWLALFVLSLLWVQLGVWASLAVLPLQGVLLFKTYRNRCQISESLVYLAGAIILGLCIFGIHEVQSFSFRDLPNYAKVSLALVFGQCWLVAEFYRRSEYVGPLSQLAEGLRIGFYLVLPLVFLPSVFKHYIEFSALVVWFSALIAYVLGHLVKHRFVRNESLAIFAAAALYNLAFYPDFYHQQAALTYLSGLIGIGFFVYFLIKTSRRHSHLLDRKVASLGIYFSAGLTLIYVTHWTNFFWAGAITYAYLFILTLVNNIHLILYRNRNLLGYLCYLGMPVSWLAIAISGDTTIVSGSTWLLVSLVISLTFLIQPRALNTLDLKLDSDNKVGFIFQHLLLSISGALLLVEWSLALLISPWLITQGSYLFFTHKHSQFIAKLALGFIFTGLLKLGFIDAANALLWQKVTLMLGIGLFMLAAAFIYQKRLAQSQDKSEA